MTLKYTATENPLASVVGICHHRIQLNLKYTVSARKNFWLWTEPWHRWGSLETSPENPRFVAQIYWSLSSNDLQMLFGQLTCQILQRCCVSQRSAFDVFQKNEEALMYADFGDIKTRGHCRAFGTWLLALRVKILFILVKLIGFSSHLNRSHVCWNQLEKDFWIGKFVLLPIATLSEARPWHF